MRTDQSNPDINIGGARSEGANVNVTVGQPPASGPPHSGTREMTWKTVIALIAATGVGASGTTYAVHNAVAPPPEISDTMAQVARDVSDLKKAINDRDLAKIAKDADVGSKFTTIEGKIDNLAMTVENLRIEIASKRGR